MDIKKFRINYAILKEKIKGQKKKKYRCYEIKDILNNPINFFRRKAGGKKSRDEDKGLFPN